MLPGARVSLCRSLSSFCGNASACVRSGPDTFFTQFQHAPRLCFPASSGFLTAERRCFDAGVGGRRRFSSLMHHPNFPFCSSNHNLFVFRGAKTAATKKTAVRTAGKAVRQGARVEKRKPTKEVQVLEQDDEEDLSQEESDYDDDENDAFQDSDLEAADNEETILEEDGFSDDLLEDDDREAVLGDGLDGGGVNLGGVDWGEKAFSIAKGVVEEFGSNFSLYAFKVSPDGTVYVRLDKLSDRYGSPSMMEIESFSSLFGNRLEKAGQDGIVPDNLALEVSSPGAERMLAVPDQLLRFKDMPMLVRYVESADGQGSGSEKDGILELESYEEESAMTVWKIANVRTNRDKAGKGRGLNRKQKDWRVCLSTSSLRVVRLYVDT